MSDSTLPERLYKYQPFTTRALENLKNRQIWFSAPIAFNDPFDCGTVAYDVEMTETEIQRLQEAMKKDARLRPDVRMTLESGMPTEHLRQQVVNGARKELAQQIKYQREQCGVACFSECNDDLLMWAHYADGHRGFCLEFDSTSEEFARFRRVTYRDSIPTLRVIDILLGSDVDIVESMLTTKNTVWSYEREWRGIHKQANIRFTVDYRKLTGIYLGAAMPDVHKEIVCLLLDGSPTNIHVMEIREGHFHVTPSARLTYTRFDYTK